MTVVDAVITRIKAISGVSASIGTRVYAEVLPQGSTLPAVKVFRVSEQEYDHLRGGGGLSAARVQVDHIAATRAAATSLAALVHGAGDGTGLNGWKGTAGSLVVAGVRALDAREDYFHDELKQWRSSRDYRVTFKAL